MHHNEDEDRRYLVGGWYFPRGDVIMVRQLISAAAYYTNTIIVSITIAISILSYQHCHQHHHWHHYEHQPPHPTW